MLNINYSHNKELLEQCKPLQDYAAFVEKTREYQRRGGSFEQAIEEAIDYCIAHDILAELLKNSREEVTRMILTEYNPKQHIQNEKAISREEGREEGLRIMIETCQSFGIAKDELTKKPQNNIGFHQMRQII